MSERQKISIALIASAFLHVLGALFLVAWTQLHPKDFPKTEEISKPLEVTLISAPTPPPVTLAAKPTPPPKLTRSSLDTDGLHPADKAPEKPLFESDINSRAGSEMPATGTVPLPSQEGKERPFQDFTTHDFSLGKGQRPAVAIAKTPASSAPGNPAPPLPEGLRVEEEPVPKPTPFFNPTPVPMNSPAPVATPKDGFALGKPTPVPAGTPAPSAPPRPTPVPQLAKLTPPTPLLRSHADANPASEPGYQQQREQTKIDGAIASKGKPGADVVATPLGRYKKSIADAIGSRWYHYVNDKRDLITVGDVHIKFYVDGDGRVSNVKILSNTANDTLGGFCVQAVTQAKIPPMPGEVAPALINGLLEVDYHFNIYPQ